MKALSPHCGRPGRDRGHARVLQEERHQRDSCPGAERHHPDRLPVLLRCRSDFAGYCRNHSDHRHGGRQHVLIFERIREEVRAGKSPHPAVDAGFAKALLTIIDTHVTTVVSCAILFLFGSGPVKGFAVTLVIGLVANIFTAVFVSKSIFDWELTRPKPVRALSI